MNPSTQHLCTALEAICAHDKTAALTALGIASRELGTGFHPDRYHVRAAECAVDISHWDEAKTHALTALRNTCDGDPALLPLPEGLHFAA